MNILIQTIAHSAQRYPTAGDYFRSSLDQDTNHILVSNLGNSDYEFLVALHELIEQKLVEKAGISESDITLWDTGHLEGDDPGSLVGAPYRQQHEFATAIEMLMAHKLGVDWAEYDKVVQAL